MNICMPVLRILSPIFFFPNPWKKMESLWHACAQWCVLGFFFFFGCFTSWDCRRASLHQPPPLNPRPKQTFAINPALVSGVRKIISFTVRLNIFSPAKLSVNLSATEITEKTCICLVVASAKSLSLVYAGKIS